MKGPRVLGGPSFPARGQNFRHVLGKYCRRKEAEPASALTPYSFPSTQVRDKPKRRGNNSASFTQA